MKADVKHHLTESECRDDIEFFIGFAVDWARRILTQNGIDPDSKDHAALLRDMESKANAMMETGEPEKIESLFEELEKERLKEPQQWERAPELHERMAKLMHPLQILKEQIIALKVIKFAKDVRETLQSMDAELVLKLMFLSRAPWCAINEEMERGNYAVLSAGYKVFSGGEKGRAARPPKLTAHQKASIRQEMTAAKHGTKKAIKLALADKHRISVREIERIAAEK